MSFFADEGAFSAPDQTERIFEAGGEVADGVVVERRSLLWLSAGAITALLAGAPTLTAQEPEPVAPPKPDRMSFEQLLAHLHPLARRIVDSDGEDEEAYLMTVAAALTRLRDPKAPLRKAMKAFRDQHQKPGERFPLAAVSMQLKPGKGFTHHDHLDYNGVIFGVEGEVRIRNYDFVDEPPALDSTDTFRVRETRDDLILPGRISTLGRKRDNVHDLVAGKEGARVLDVFTFFTGRATSRYLDVESKPRDAERRIHDATWRPRRRRR